MGQTLNLSSLLKKYFGDERVLSVAKFLEEKRNVSVKGLAGSSLSVILRAVSDSPSRSASAEQGTKKGIHLVIVQDKEEAAYLLNDLETFEGGNNGNTGNIGNTGDTGSTGNTGTKGSTGSTGTSGSTGLTGSTGSTGRTGSTGSRR